MGTTVDTEATLRELLPHFRAAHGVPPDGAQGQSHWYLGRGLLHVRMPNFAWRRRALPLHDAPHLLTGYPCTPAGEMQMAAWEFAAGRFPHAGATAFCLPLVGMGAVCFPRRTFAAFVRGRRSRSLYGEGDDVLALRVGQARERFIADAQRATARDGVAYVGIVALSLALIAAPCIVLALLLVSW